MSPYRIWSIMFISFTFGETIAFAISFMNPQFWVVAIPFTIIFTGVAALFAFND